MIKVNKGTLNGYIYVPCGKCLICQRNLVADWRFRLELEAEASRNVYFITLTYNEETLIYNNSFPTLCVSDLQKFFKRLRKYIKFRYFAVGEYGTKSNRPHYHILFFTQQHIEWLKLRNLVQKCWSSRIDVQGARDIKRLASYCSKYCFKNDNRLSMDYQKKPFRVCSKKPIIGYLYLEKYQKFHRVNQDFRFKSVFSKPNSPRRLPRAFQKKIYDDEHDPKKMFRLSQLLTKPMYTKNEIANYIKMGDSRLRNDYTNFVANYRDQRQKAEQIQSQRLKKDINEKVD